MGKTYSTSQGLVIGETKYMKVLIVANYEPSAGGISGQVTQLKNHLVLDGHDVEIFSLRMSWTKRLTCGKELRRRIREADIVHVHCCSKFGFYTALMGVNLAKKEGKRVVVTYHGGGAEKFFKTWHGLVRRTLLKADANIVLSGFLAKVFSEYNIPYCIIPNILPIGENHYKERTKINPKFISVRTLSPLYNIECIIRAFAIVKDRIKDATLDILADGPSKDKLIALTDSLKLRDVNFLGRIPNTNIYDYLNNADIFLSTPRIDNQPMSVLEANKCGLIVISSNVGGVPYLVKDGETGLLVESDNHKKLAEKMMWAVNNSDEAIKIARAGHKALENYTWEAIKDDIYTCYGVK